MKRLIVPFCVFLLLLISIVFAITLSREQKADLRVCHQDCLSEKKASLAACKSENSACLNFCKANFTICVDKIESTREACLGSCEHSYELIANFSDNRTRMLEAKKELGFCKRECLMQARESRKNDCNIAPCRKECADEKKQCEEYAKGNHSACYLGCFDYVINKDYTVNETANENDDLGPLDFPDINATTEINESVDVNSTETNQTQTNETENESSSFNNSCEPNGIRTSGCAAV